MADTSWRCELHCHSNYSRDCAITTDQLIAICVRKKINAIALTDHNEIAGAVELAEKAPSGLFVIVGEEIATQEGDVIGLFLTSKIAPRQPIAETIAQIKGQNGVVLLPHPFDRIRHEAVGPAVVDAIKNDIDFIEIFNSRCLFPADNRRAARFAKSHTLAPFVGSDAHVARECGRSVAIMSPFTHAESFKRSLQRATFQTRRSSPLVHVETKLVKRRTHAH